MKLNLVRRKSEVPGVESFIFRPTESLSWRAGQYLHYVLHHEPTDSRGSDRWFTVASAPHEKEVMITTRHADEKGSSFKSALFAMQVGEEIEISSVEGNFTVEDTGQEYVFIAGGIGITPFHSILKEADKNGEKLKVTLIYSNRSEQIPFKTELDGFVRNNPDLHIHYVTSPQRIDYETISSIVSDMKKPIFYISGPAPMVFSLSENLENMQIPKDHIKLDDFPGYEAI
jgi:ferredoxin-NADP reductase